MPRKGGAAGWDQRLSLGQGCSFRLALQCSLHTPEASLGRDQPWGCWRPQAICLALHAGRTRARVTVGSHGPSHPLSSGTGLGDAPHQCGLCRDAAQPRTSLRGLTGSDYCPASSNRKKLEVINGHLIEPCLHPFHYHPAAGMGAAGGTQQRGYPEPAVGRRRESRGLTAVYRKMGYFLV